MSNERKPDITDPTTWPHADEAWGRSPILDALPSIRAWNALPPDEKAKAAAAWVRERIRSGAYDD